MRKNNPTRPPGFRYQRSLADLEALYGALSQQAFKGEFDISRVPLPVMPVEGAQSR